MCNICQKPEGKFVMSSLPGKMCVACHDALLKARSGKIDEAKSYFGSITFTSSAAMRFIQNEIDMSFDNSMSDDDRQAYMEKQDSELKAILLSTSDSIIGHKIDSSSCGNIVTGISVLGTGFFSELNASISDMLGVNSSALESKVSDAQDNALNMLKKEAHRFGCNAVISISISFVPFSGNMIGIVATGTAVKVIPCNS